MFETSDLSELDLKKLLLRKEDHFFDFKSKRIKPATLQETFVAFANADGGELIIGIEDEKVSGERVRPFLNPEEANALIHVLLEETEPAVEGVRIEFLAVTNGVLLHITIPKSPKVHYTSSGDCYVKLNAKKNKIKGERITALGYSKGVLVYEKQSVNNLEVDEIIASPELTEYMARINTSLSAERFLHKQRLISKDNDLIERPNVACALLFDEEPQASLDTRCAVKVYRLRTTDTEYKREHLAEVPITINGSLEKVVKGAISKVKEYIDGASTYDGQSLIKMQYPADAIQEVLVNAVLHRDYSLNDDIHVKIFDDRIEVTSPGKLPGYMTIENIYEERYSRNPNLVRMLHNLPNPLNHDIGEGLDTVKNELRKVGLVPPTFVEKENTFVVIMRHQKLASLEDVIFEYFKDNPNGYITNKLIRQLSGESNINKVKTALQKLRADKKIEVVDDSVAAFYYQYREVKE
ncbi:MAG TPA: ATP-binding protein [Sphingobacteriaceae bacterium]|nr:ATP-binding protein [Sphingobacteriaceae bacterium]